MAGEDKLAHGGLPFDRTVKQPHDAAVRLTAHDGEFTEILVECHEDVLLITGRTRIATSPGSAGQSPTQTTSCPESRSALAAFPDRQVSSSSLMAQR